MRNHNRKRARRKSHEEAQGNEIGMGEDERNDRARRPGRGEGVDGAGRGKCERKKAGVSDKGKDGDAREEEEERANEDPRSSRKG